MRPLTRQILWALLCIAAFSACMIPIQKAFADNNTVEIRALAVCKDNKCVMAEEDYKRLKEFVKETQSRAEHNNEIEQNVNQMIGELRGALESCRDQQRKWKS